MVGSVEVLDLDVDVVRRSVGTFLRQALVQGLASSLFLGGDPERFRPEGMVGELDHRFQVLAGVVLGIEIRVEPFGVFGCHGSPHPSWCLPRWYGVAPMTRLLASTP